MDTVGAQSWNGSLMETLIKIVFFHLHLRHCGKPKGPKAEDVLFLCVSIRMCCIFLYHWYCDGYVYFLIVIAKLSLLGLKDPQLFVNLSSSPLNSSVFKCCSFCASYRAQLERPGWLKSQAKKSSWDCWYRARYVSGMSSWTQFIPNVWFFREPQETDPVGRPFWR